MELLEENKMLKSILNAYPYPIVFIDNDYIIRYMNQNAEYHYYKMRGYKNLIGKNMMDCHDHQASKDKIVEYYNKMKSDGKPRFVTVNTENQRMYMQPVKNEKGEWIGFFERFELNLEMPVPFTLPR